MGFSLNYRQVLIVNGKSHVFSYEQGNICDIIREAESRMEDLGAASRRLQIIASQSGQKRKAEVAPASTTKLAVESASGKPQSSSFERVRPPPGETLTKDFWLASLPQTTDPIIEKGAMLLAQRVIGWRADE